MAKTPSEINVDIDFSETISKAFAPLVELITLNKIGIEVIDAVKQARAKHGKQDELDFGTGPDKDLLWELDEIAATNLELMRNASLERVAKKLCQSAAADGEVTWAHILFEEVAEALAAEDEKALRAELLQVGAMAFSMIQIIDERAAATA